MPPRIAAFASRIGLTGLAIAVLIALLAVQTVRLEGASLWPLSIEGARPKAERLQRTLDEIKHRQVEALAKAQQAKWVAEQKYRNLAEMVDHNADKDRKNALAAAERFIATRGLRCQAAASPGRRALASADDSGAGLPEGAGEVAELVAVPGDDIRICTENTVKLVNARVWALGLEASSKP